MQIEQEIHAATRYSARRILNFVHFCEGTYIDEEGFDSHGIDFKAKHREIE